MIEILKGRVNWMEGLGNNPRLQLLLSRIPTADELRYEQRDTLYFAEKDGYCEFFSWRGVKDRGFGGRQFPITMKDGSAVTLHGPWSSSSSTMNAAGFTPCRDADVTDDPAVFERGHTFFGGNVTIDLLKRHLDRIEFPRTYRWRSEPRIYPEYDRSIDFPNDSKLELLHLSSKGNRILDMSDEQMSMLGGEGERYEIGVRMPDGSLWRKP